MAYDPEIHHRRSIRLQNYDYSQAGAYYLTFCVANRLPHLGKITNNRLETSEIGLIVQSHWLVLEQHHPLTLDAFVMMPNHVHGIVVLQATHEGRGLAHVVQQFKAFSTKAINRAQQTRGPFWQRNYYEHIIRDDGDLERIRQYIAENPLRWSEDAEYIS